MEVKSDAIKNNIAYKPGIKVNWKWSNRRYEHRHFRSTFQESVSKKGLEWVNLTQMTIISSTVGKNPLKEMEQPSQSTKVQNAVLGCSLKKDRMILVHFQGKAFNVAVIQVYAPTTNAEEGEDEWFYDDLKTFQN